MKQYMKKMMMAAALLLMTTGIWAVGNVTTNVLPVLQSGNAGTVIYFIDQATDQGTPIRLEVMPSKGYKASLENVSVELKVNGSVAQTPRRTPGIYHVELTATDPEADPSNETWYSFVVPNDDNYDVEVTVNFQSITTYNIFIGDKQVTELNMADVLGDGDGKVTFAVSVDQNQNSVYTLTLKGIDLTVPVIVGLPNLTIDVQGTNTITTTETCIQKMEKTDPSLTFKSTSDVVGSLTLTNTDEENYDGVSGIGNVTISKELAPILRNNGNYTSYMYEFTNGGCDKAMFVPSYGVKVGNLYVYEGNTRDVLGDGTVSFDKANHTLTLTDAKVGGSNEGSISTWLPALTIEVVGNNMLTSGSQSTLQSLYGENVTMTVQSTGETKGCLVLKMGSSDGVFAGEHVELNITSPLEVVSGNLNENDGNLNVVTIGEPVDYELLVEDIRVVAANASNITNDTNRSGRPYASFDAATNTLTLNGCNFYYYWLGTKVPVQSNIQNLKVKLVGDNTVTLGTKVFDYTGVASETAPKLTFETDFVDGAFGSLKINGTTSTAAIANGYEVANTLLPAETNQGATGWLYSVGDNYLKLWYQEVYGITVTKGDVSVVVSYANRLDVLGDGDATVEKPASVQFDGRSRLVLNAAELTSIVVSDKNNLPASGLEIYLEGNSKISNDLGYAIKSEYSESQLDLALHTGADAPGTLEYTNNGAAPNNVFEAFDVTYYNKLVKFVEGKVTTVRIPIDLITDDVDDPAKIDYGNGTGYSEGTTLNGTTIENVLYTLSDDGTPDAPDGFVSGTGGKLSLVINSTMTDLEVEASDALVPGTSDYYNGFKGLTFTVVGTGVITLFNVVTDPGYAFHVRVGNQPPVEVTTADVVDVPYACSDVSYVKIYLVDLTPGQQGAPAVVMANRRIGPKSSVAGGLGGISVQGNNMQAAPDPAAPYKSMDLAAVAGLIAKIGDARSGFICDDKDITDLPDNMFVSGSSAPALHRANVTGTILPEGLTFIDFSKTKITGMEIDRKKDGNPFYRVPDNTFIYMPAGNTIASGTKNVVIGGICDVMELDGSENAKPFKAMKNFQAGHATLNRTFEAGSDASKATVYLPYAISQTDADKLGKFYQYAGMTGTTVNMTQVTSGGLKANMPYIFEAKEGGVTDLKVHAASVEANPAETDGFKGVYERKDYEAGMYCYAGENKGGYSVGQFVDMGPGSYVTPFRAYMVGDGAPSYAIAWDGVIDDPQNDENATAIETVKTVADKKVAEGWWTLNGMRLNAQPKKAGLYVKDGRLVVVK